jgi:hypothetical protein
MEAEHGDTASAFDHLTLAIRNCRFHGREPRIEELVSIAWEEPWLITVEESRYDPRWPSAIILRPPASDLHR